jgi:hypothetical protein
MAGVVEQFPLRVQQLTQQAIEQNPAATTRNSSIGRAAGFGFEFFRTFCFICPFSMDEPLHIAASQWLISDWIGPLGRRNRRKQMKMSWTKPTMCQVPAGLEISRYLPAKMTPKK